MEKPAPTDYPILDLIRRRWSPLAFADRPVEPEKLATVFEAARWSASSFNEQPWAFLVAIKNDPDRPDDFDQMLHCLTEGNVPWAGKAPVLIVSLAKLYFDHNQKANRHAHHDVGMATANLTLQALALDLWVHPMAGFHVDKVRQEYNVPDAYEPLTAMALGYAGDPATLPEKLRQRSDAPRSRKPMDSFVFGGSFGKPSSLAARR